jgi:hypothetical protein
MITSDSGEITLAAENIEWIREALLIGLICYGEIEKKVAASDFAESMGCRWPDDMRPIHPTGTSDVTSKFATALMVIS